MFSKATVAAAAPFLLGMTQASPAPAAVRPNIFSSLLTPNFPVALPVFVREPDTSPAPAQPANADISGSLVASTSLNVSLDQSSLALIALGGGYDYDFACNPYSDWDCYKRWWDYYRYCHPYDRKCYRDCDNYGDYYGSCKNYDKSYGKCYDRCYYDKDNCKKYRDCDDDDDSCYKKKRKDDYCYPPYDERYDENCKDKHDPPEDYCKPWDYECHRKSPEWNKPGFGRPPFDKPHKPHKPEDPYDPYYPPEKPKYPPHKPEYPDHEYVCYPGRDKDCYPEIPEFPDYDHGDEHHHEPKKDIVVKFYNKWGLLYEEKIWPDGQEFYTKDKDGEVVEYIKYYAEDEKDIRCLVLKNWFPWNPLPLYSYKEKKEYGHVVRTLELKKPQPIEVIRCDFI
ncbi:unnamed protein product [Discula destructiva]